MDEITALHARIAELEAEIASLQPKPRVARRRAQATEPCQYCNDTKTLKLTFLGLPLCAGIAQGGDGKCGSRIRSNATRGRSQDAYAYDGRYSVRRESNNDPAYEWVARFDGQFLTAGADRGAVRRCASEHKAAERVAA
jgi:hypothetical protein